MNETFLGKISDFSIPINAPSLCGQKSGRSHHRLPKRCGIQSQVMAAAQMAFWARMHGLTRADIRSALWKSRTLEIQPFENFSRSIHRKIQEEAASLGDFLETSWEIKFSRRLFG